MTKLSELPEYHPMPVAGFLGWKQSPFEESILHAAGKFYMDLRDLIIAGRLDGSWRVYRGWMRYRDYEVNFEIPHDRFEDYGYRIVDRVIHNVIRQLREAVDGREVDRISEMIKVRSLPGKVRVIRMKGRRNGNTIRVEAGGEQSS